MGSPVSSSPAYVHFLSSRRLAITHNIMGTSELLVFKQSCFNSYLNVKISVSYLKITEHYQLLVVGFKCVEKTRPYLPSSSSSRWEDFALVRDRNEYERPCLPFYTEMCKWVGKAFFFNTGYIHIHCPEGKWTTGERTHWDMYKHLPQRTFRLSAMLKWC